MANNWQDLRDYIHRPDVQAAVARQSGPPEAEEQEQPEQMEMEGI